MQEYNHLEWARRQGVPVPRAAAVGEPDRPGLPAVQLPGGRGADAGMLPLHEAIPLAQERLTPGDFRLWKRGLTVELARLARLLHDRRHFRTRICTCATSSSAKDDTARLPESAALPDGWRGRVFLIDLHRLGHHPWTWWLWQWKDLGATAVLVGRCGRGRAAIRGPPSGSTTAVRAACCRSLGRCCARRCSLKWRLYRRHNAKRRRLRA